MLKKISFPLILSMRALGCFTQSVACYDSQPRKQQPLMVFALKVSALLLALCTMLPFTADAQGPTPVDVFHSLAYGRRNIDFNYEAPMMSFAEMQRRKLSEYLGKIIDYKGDLSQWRSQDESNGFIGVDMDFLSMTALDLTKQQMKDYFCVGTEIKIGVPTGWSFKSATIRYWTDYPKETLQAWKTVPQTENGTWSKTDTSGWSIGGSVGFFGQTPTANVNADYSFSTSNTISFRDVVVTEHSRAKSGNDPAWEFTNMAGSDTPSGGTNAPTLTFYDQFLLRGDSNLIRQQPDFFGPLAVKESNGAQVGYTPRDKLPGLKIYFQVTLHVTKQSGNTGYYQKFAGPVDSFVVPFAPMPYLSPPSGSHMGVVNDAGNPYYKMMTSGKSSLLVETSPSDPLQWAEKVNQEDLQLDAKMKTKKYFGTCDQDQVFNPKKPTCLPVSWDWATPARVVDIGDTNFLQATVRIHSPFINSSVYGPPTAVRSVRMSRDPNAPNDPSGADYHIIPTSVIYNLLTYGFQQENLHEETQDWLKETGWTYQIFSNDSETVGKGFFTPTDIPKEK